MRIHCFPDCMPDECTIHRKPEYFDRKYDELCEDQSGIWSALFLTFAELSAVLDRKVEEHDVSDSCDCREGTDYD